MKTYFDISHIFEYPPQPSTLMGLGLLAGVVVALVLAPEAAPIIVPLVAGVLHIAMPDNSSVRDDS